jgi:predicted CXXCH cytochrome family protein
MRSLLIPLLAALAAFTPFDAYAKCNVCHSKNPKMVRMHEALGFKDCFKCHNPFDGKAPEDRRHHKSSDPLCLICHEGNEP